MFMNKIWYVILFLALVSISAWSYGQSTKSGFKTGNWIGIIQLDDAGHGSDMPFNFKHIVAQNGKSAIEITKSR